MLRGMDSDVAELELMLERGAEDGFSVGARVVRPGVEGDDRLPEPARFVLDRNALLEHVMDPAGKVRGVRFVNDSKATNVEAARRSIESFERGVVALVGGRFKGGNLRELREPLAARGRAVIAIGEAAPLVQEALDGVVPIVTASSMPEAVARGYEKAVPDGVVLLAPACASFDWFADYAERGHAFKEEVEKLRKSVERAL